MVDNFSKKTKKLNGGYFSQITFTGVKGAYFCKEQILPLRGKPTYNNTSLHLLDFEYSISHSCYRDSLSCFSSLSNCSSFVFTQYASYAVRVHSDILSTESSLAAVVSPSSSPIQVCFLTLFPS